MATVWESLDPQPPGALGACVGLYRDSFTYLIALNVVTFLRIWINAKSEKQGNKFCELITNELRWIFLHFTADFAPWPQPSGIEEILFYNTPRDGLLILLCFLSQFIAKFQSHLTVQHLIYSVYETSTNDERIDRSFLRGQFCCNTKMVNAVWRHIHSDFSMALKLLSNYSAKTFLIKMLWNEIVNQISFPTDNESYNCQRHIKKANINFRASIY